MPHNSPFQIDIPRSNILSFLFPPSLPLSDRPLWIDAEDTAKVLSSRTAVQWIKRLAMGLKRKGLQRGRVCLVFSTSHIFLPVAYLAIVGMGSVFSGCNPVYGVEEVAFQIKDTGADIILVDPSLLGILEKATQKTGFAKGRIFLFSDSTVRETRGFEDWSSILASEKEACEWKWPELVPDKADSCTAVLNYSSGTTGMPKGVCITHSNIIANTAQSLHMRDLPAPNSHPERWLGFLPLYHAYGQLWSISAAAKTGTPVFLMPSFDFLSFLKHIQAHKITHIQTAPPVLVMLSKRPETESFDLSSLQNILCGAAPLSSDLQNQVSERFGLRVVQTWGMTELTCSSLHVPGGLDDRSGAVGLIDPNCSMKLIDDDGREVGPGKRGEILVKGPNVCAGYWQNQAATKAAFDDDGYLKTGDIGVMDSKGWFWIVDRKKELIKVRGFQVPPAELEAVLLGHDGIADAAVVGIRLDHEELPRAYVVLKSDNGSLFERDIAHWLAGRVAKHKQLLGGVEFVDEVPKSPSGKIQRKILREWAERDAKRWKKSSKARL